MRGAGRLHRADPLELDQRAVLILRDVLGFSAREAAEALESTPASVNSALQRARKAVEERLPERSQQATLRAIGDERLREIVERYVDACERGDVDAIVALLAEDATIAMPPWATWWPGRDVIAGFVRRDGGDEWRLVPTRASGQLAAAVYGWDVGRHSYVPDALEVLALEDARIKHITAFAIPSSSLTSDCPASFGRRPRPLGARPQREGPQHRPS